MKERPILFSDPMVRAILDGTKTQTRRVVNLPFEPRGSWIEGGGEISVCRIPDIERIAHPDPNSQWARVRCPYGVPGDRLWVREAWASVALSYDWETGYCDVVSDCDPESVKGLMAGAHPFGRPSASIWYRAEYGDRETIEERGFRWRPSIHMPRWACRLVLEVTDVRVERVQDITPPDAIEEGVTEWATKEQHRLLFDEQGRRRDEPLGPSPLDGTRRGLPYLVNAFADLWDSINAARGYGWDVNPLVFVVSFRRLDDVAQRGAA